MVSSNAVTTASTNIFCFTGFLNWKNIDPITKTDVTRSLDEKTFALSMWIVYKFVRLKNQKAVMGLSKLSVSSVIYAGYRCVKMSQRSRLPSEMQFRMEKNARHPLGVPKSLVVLFSQSFSSIALTVALCAGLLFNKTRSFHFCFATNNLHTMEWPVKFKIRSFEWKQEATFYSNYNLIWCPNAVHPWNWRTLVVSFIVTSSPKTNRCQVLDRFRGQRTSDWCGSRRAGYKSDSRP